MGNYTIELGSKPYRLHSGALFARMTPQPSPTEQGTQSHQPQLVHKSSVPAGHHIVFPSTPLPVPLETPRRHTRRSQQKFNVQTLPGTRWDELEIERQRERRRDREPASDIISGPSFSRLSLHNNGAHVSSSQSASPTDLDFSPTVSQTHPPARQSGDPWIGFIEETPSQELIPASSPAKRRRPTQRVPVKHRVPSQGRGKSASEAGINTQSPFLVPDLVVEEHHPSTMARRPGRNQVDYVAEWKEAIFESLSKLSDIQGKMALLNQQIVRLEEELKAKEGDSSKLKAAFDPPDFASLPQLLTRAETQALRWKIPRRWMNCTEPWSSSLTKRPPSWTASKMV